MKITRTYLNHFASNVLHCKAQVVRPMNTKIYCRLPKWYIQWVGNHLSKHWSRKLWEVHTCKVHKMHFAVTKPPIPCMVGKNRVKQKPFSKSSQSCPFLKLPPTLFKIVLTSQITKVPTSNNQITRQSSESCWKNSCNKWVPCLTYLLLVIYLNESTTNIQNRNLELTDYINNSINVILISLMRENVSKETVNSISVSINQKSATLT